VFYPMNKLHPILWSFFGDLDTPLPLCLPFFCPSSTYLPLFIPLSTITPIKAGELRVMLPGPFLPFLPIAVPPSEYSDQMNLFLCKAKIGDRCRSLSSSGFPVCAPPFRGTESTSLLSFCELKAPWRFPLFLEGVRF